MGEGSVTLYTALDTFSDNITEIRSSIVDNIQGILAEEGRGDWVRTEITRLRVLPLHGLLKRINSWEQSRLKPRAGAITPQMIERAKEFPIEDIYDGQLRKGAGLCPFHQEKTPSFHIKNNKYNCFGCGAHGDAIDFYMKMNNVGFIQAVKAMQ